MSKTILITGSTDGIGKLAAIKMAKDDHQIYLHGRDTNKLNKVISEIKEETGNQKIEGFVADFTDLGQVEKMSEEINEKISRIDVLINNAGVFKSSQSLTKDGLDIRMVVNYFAPYLLTRNIIDKLKVNAELRIINLSSAAQSAVSFDLLKGDVEVSDQEAYAQSKLAILMWSFYLAQHEPKISVLALNPGSLLNTNMVREAYGRFWSSADKGADIIYNTSLTMKAKDIDGKYFDNDSGAFNRAHPDAYDKALISTLIEETDKKLRGIL